MKHGPKGKPCQRVSGEDLSPITRARGWPPSPALKALDTNTRQNNATNRGLKHFSDAREKILNKGNLWEMTGL